MPDRIEEIRERWEKATPGPWKWHRNDREGFYSFLGTEGYRDVLEAEDFTAGYTDMGCTPGITIENEHDAAFIAAAPEDIEYLLAEVERLNRENMMYKGRCP